MSARRTGTPSVRIQILSSFRLASDGAEVRLPMGVQRLVVFVAVQERPMLRSYVAGTLWPEGTDAQAGANLRSALWRLHRDAHTVVETDGQTLRLAPDVDVDVHRLTELARQVCEAPLDSNDGLCLDPMRFDEDVLPDWYDDWLVFARERYHQYRLHALESISERLTQAGDLTAALQAALAAVTGEPLRESAHRALARVHLAEGNRAEAVRQLELYRSILREQLGIEPSEQIVALVHAGDAALTRA